MVRQQLFIGAALMAGVAIGFFVQPEPAAAPAAPRPASGTGGAARIADRGASASAAALRARVRELEAALARAQAGDEGAAASNGVARPEGPRSWREILRRDDPARYAQMTNRVARWRQSCRDFQEVRASFLSSIDTSGMDADALKTHAAYQALLSLREDLEDRLQSADLDEAGRDALIREIGAVSRSLRVEGARERQVLFGQVARAMGLEGAAATDLQLTIYDIIEATSPVRTGAQSFLQPPSGP